MALFIPLGGGQRVQRKPAPHEAPATDPQHLTEPVDLEKLIEGIRRSREIPRTPPLDEHLGEEMWPGTGLNRELPGFTTLLLAPS